MVLYNFKKITVVPGAKDMVDIILSKTNRKTPTEVHPQFEISRIRSFYIRKVKFTSQSYHDKLTEILDEFPILDDIHPFYADLMNVLYDRDHYKLALGQINVARSLIDNVAKDYFKLLKYGDSLYRCKQLKRAALGRMSTIILKQNSSLAYLEQVRQHLARLPSIEPNARTLIICGYPNVGKSSFVNKVTRANVDVQPYAFTTKSLFIGHTDYQYLNWQVIDTPGILDHPLEERNTIEMQAITALAHLRAAILYFIDISEQCGYNIKQQVALYDSIRPLFTNKPVLVVLNKIDVIKVEDLKPDDRALIENISKDGTELISMSALTDEGVSNVKQVACDKLLAMRVETKLKNNKVSDILNRIHLAMPKPRDDRVRGPSIPDSVFKAKEMKQQLMDDETEEQPEPEVPFWERGFNSIEWKKKYKLKNPDWRFDIIPEIVNGVNIIDYIDPEILKKLEALEEEEERRMEELMNEEEDTEGMIPLTEEQRELIRQIQKKKAEIKARKGTSGSSEVEMPRHHGTDREKDVETFEAHLSELGIDPSKAVARLRSRSREILDRTARKRTRSAEPMETADLEDEDDMDEDHKRQRLVSKSRESRSRSRTRSKTPREEGLKDFTQKLKAVKMARKAQFQMGKNARKGEGDRHVYDLKPKHLYSGKRTNGTNDRR